MARSSLVIGIARYNNFRNLEKVVNDAGAIAEILEHHGHYAIEPLPRKLTDGDENRFELDQDPKKEVKSKDLIAKIKTFLSEQAKGKDALIYFAGHGFVQPDDAGDNIGYFAAADAGKDGQNGLSFDIFTKLVAKSELNSLVVLIDCCNAGNLLDRTQYQAMQQVFNQKNYYLMAACRGDEKAREGAEHGIFTAAVLAVLQTKIKAGEAVDADSLFSQVSQRLKQSGQEVVRSAMGGAITLIEKTRANLTPVVKETCPYVGLNAFDDKTAHWFFGRDKALGNLHQKLNKSSFVFVVGVSGSGKSSLVRAKLIPEYSNEKGYQVFVIKPRRNPLEQLKSVFTSDLNEADLDVIEAIEQLIDRGDLLSAVKELTQKPVLLVIDQFEEVFTLCSQKQEQGKFLKMLALVAEQSTADLVVVATMRADFMGECSDTNLDKIINEQMVWLSPMTKAEFTEAIVKPALTQRYELGEGLLEGILSDIEAEPNCLPLLEFALQKLWDHRDQQHRKLTADAYYRILKKIRGALNLHAETLYQGRSEAKQKWIRRLLLQLVRTGQDVKDTRQPTERQTLLALGKNAQEKKEIEIVLRALEGETGRLLTAYDENGIAMVDMAHEALMDGWERFQDWRLEHRQLRLLAGRIKDDHKQWLQVPEPDKDSFLLAQGVVILVEKVITEIIEYINSAQEEYLEQSIYKYKPWLNPGNLPEMVEIPAGQFWMGSPEGRGNDNEKPYHLVTLKAFRLGKYPITQAQWRTIALSPKIHRDLSLNPFRFQGNSFPVERVSWYDAEEFCARLSNLTGETYRLPSEAEWEYACRAGMQKYTKYCFGDNLNKLKDYAWFRENSEGTTHTLGQKNPNDWGLYDMHGNVWELCADDWQENYRSVPKDGTAQINNSDYDQGDNVTKVMRGGSWLHNAEHCYSGFRSSLNVFSYDDYYGFRIAYGSLLPKTL